MKRLLCAAAIAAIAVGITAGGGCQAGGGRRNAGAPGPNLGGRPDGVRPDVGQRSLDPRGLDPRWAIYLEEKILGTWIVGDAVYAFTAKQNVYAIGLDDGYVRWVYNLKADLSYPPAAYSYKADGIARKDEVFLISKDTLHCVDKDAGYALWKKRLPFAAASAPAASISHVYVGSWDDRVYAIDKDDRTIDWSYRTGGPVTARSDAAEKTVEAVYVGSEDGTVYAMHPNREERKWAFETRGAIVARPLFFRTYVYAGSKDFNLYSIRALDGNLEWRYPTGGPILKDPVAYAKEKGGAREITVYVVSGDSLLFAMNPNADAKADRVRWRYDGAQLVLGQGRRDVYTVDRNGDVIALADDTGKPRWEKPLFVGADYFAQNPYEATSPVERDRKHAGTLVFGYRDGWLIAVKEKSEF